MIGSYDCFGVSSLVAVSGVGVGLMNISLLSLKLSILFINSCISVFSVLLSMSVPCLSFTNWFAILNCPFIIYSPRSDL